MTTRAPEVVIIILYVPHCVFITLVVNWNWAELCWKLAERAHCPETRTSCLQFATLCLDILSRPICKDGHPWAAARFPWIIGRSRSLQPQRQPQPQPGIHTWWLRSCRHFQPPKKYCDVSDKFYIAIPRQLNFKNIAKGTTDPGVDCFNQ